MARMRPPTVPETPVPVVGDEALRRLLGACDGRGYEERRDAAIIRVFLDCGLRLAELTALKVADVDFDYGNRSEGLPVWLPASALPVSHGAEESVDCFVRLDRAEHDLLSVADPAWSSAEQAGAPADERPDAAGDQRTGHGIRAMPPAQPAVGAGSAQSGTCKGVCLGHGHGTDASSADLAGANVLWEFEPNFKQDGA